MKVPDSLRPSKAAVPFPMRSRVPAPVVELDSAGLIARSDIWCSVCEGKGKHAEAATVPAKPLRFGDQRLDNILNWFRVRKERMPIVLATQHSQYLLRVSAGKTRHSKDMENWLKTLFPESKQRLTAHARAHAMVFAMIQEEGRLAYSVGVGAQDPLKAGAKTDYGKSNGILPAPRQHYGSRGRMELVVIDDHKTYKSFGRHFFGAFGKETLHWFNVKSDSNTGIIDSATIKQRGLHGRMTHMLSHVFNASYRRYFNHLPGWFFAGHALSFEMFAEPTSMTFCIGNGANRLSSRRVPIRSWRSHLHGRVRSGKMTPIVRLLSKQDIGDLTYDERIESWGLVQFLMVCKRNHFRIFMDVLKTQNKSETLLELQYRAVRSAYGVDLITWEKAWHAWL